MLPFLFLVCCASALLKTSFSASKECQPRSPQTHVGCFLASNKSLSRPPLSSTFDEPPLPDPDLERTIFELVEAHGFHLEVHTVQTLDGYTLSLHRLVDGRWSTLPESSKPKSTRSPKKAVIVQHGLFGSSADFLISSPFLTAPDGGTGDNLAFALHLTGRYDVWLANSRGNEYSTNEYRPQYRKLFLIFWDF